MLKLTFGIGVASLLAAAIAGLPFPLPAQTTNRPAAAKPPAAQKAPAPIPFQGKIDAVDKVARTITVGKRVFQITSETKIYKADKTPALFEDAVVAEHITGSYAKAADGKLPAKSIYLGTKPDAKAPAPTSAAKSRTRQCPMLFARSPANAATNSSCSWLPLSELGLRGLLDEQLAAGLPDRHAELIVAQEAVGGVLGQHPHQRVAGGLRDFRRPSTLFGGRKAVCTCAATSSSTVGASNGTWPVSA